MCAKVESGRSNTATEGKAKIKLYGKNMASYGHIYVLCDYVWNGKMSVVRIISTACVASLFIASSALAATYTQTTTGSLCSITADVSPDADACFGTTLENANAQQVNLNSDMFTVGTTTVTGLFGYTDWTTFQSVGSVSGDQKTGTIAVNTNTYGMVAVLLKSANTFAAYRFDNGLNGILSFFTPNDSGLSNYVIAGRNPSPVPLPAAGWMLLAGVGGLAAMRRRKKRS
ncbi:hypothetical protein SuNHUV7_35170 (plasmid) [Pseudoseohaeicola sp. NH-UV-7]|uniref:VPLPA-CTERM sorting domain-containing protein n=1 Tax=Sulfitobacter sp. TBRI5 TaxID=2989732 RepID=UPI003A6F2EE6